MTTHRTPEQSRRRTHRGTGRFTARLRHAVAIAAAGLMLTGTPVIAADFKDAVVQQLVEQGFREFRISRTLLGRTRVVATSKTLRREIIFNPVTGEVLRDHWRDKDESPRLIQRANNEIGQRELRAPVLADPATPPTASAAVAPSKEDDSGDADQDTKADTGGSVNADTSDSVDNVETPDAADNAETPDAADNDASQGSTGDAGSADGDAGGADSGGDADSGAGGEAQGSESEATSG